MTVLFSRISTGSVGFHQTHPSIQLSQINLHLLGPPSRLPWWLRWWSVLLTTRKTWVWSLSREDPLEKEMAPHSSTPAWRIPWTEEPGRCSPQGRWGSDTTERFHFHFSLSCIGEGNGNPLQCSCLENPRDGGWAAVYGLGHDWSDLAAAAAATTLK